MVNPEVHSGEHATINAISQVRDWQINDNGTLAAFRNSGTAVGMGRKAGVTSWQGSYQADGAQPAKLPGQSFTFYGYTAPDNDISGYGETYQGTVFVDSATINWDWATGAIITNAIAFSGHLALTATSGDTQIVDSGVSVPEGTDGTKVEYSADNGTTWVELKNLTQAQLTLQCANPAYVNSSTAVGGVVCTGRKPGPLDASASLVMESNLLGSGLTKGQIVMLRFYTDATHFFEVKWMAVKEFVGLNANPQTGAIMTHSISFEQAATNIVSSVNTLGWIKLPDTTTYWPFS